MATDQRGFLLDGIRNKDSGKQSKLAAARNQKKCRLAAEARRQYEEALQLNPNYDAARRGLRELTAR